MAIRVPKRLPVKSRLTQNPLMVKVGAAIAHRRALEVRDLRRPTAGESRTIAEMPVYSSIFRAAAKDKRITDMVLGFHPHFAPAVREPYRPAIPPSPTPVAAHP
jgi:hypothetical protein